MRYKRAAVYLVFLSVVFLVVYGSADWLAELVPYRLNLGEPGWTFRPEWAWLYLSLNVLLVYAFLRLEEESRAGLFTSLCLQTLIAWPFFVLLPIRQPELPFQPDTWWFHAADSLNLKNNMLPSLHVAYAVTCSLYLSNALGFLWAAAVAVSTVLTYQHYPVDVLAGALLALGVTVWCGGRGRVLADCVGELVRCGMRHRRYFLIGVALIGHVLVRPRAGWKALLGFCYLQCIDDLLDGQLGCEGESEEVATTQVRHWRSAKFGEDSLGRMGRALHSVLPETDHFVAIIEEMCLDRRRVRDGLRLNEDELRKHLRTTFRLSLDLMLLASGARLRAADAPALVDLLGWCSVVRDLEEDLTLGLINVPIEAEDDVRAWFEKYRSEAEGWYETAGRELETQKERSGYRLLNMFRRSVKKYLKSCDPEMLTSIWYRCKRSGRALPSSRHESSSCRLPIQRLPGSIRQL